MAPPACRSVVLRPPVQRPVETVPLVELLDKRAKRFDLAHTPLKKMQLALFSNAHRLIATEAKDPNG